MLMHMEIPALLVGLFCAGALAASMSSGDAMVHATASIVVRDGMVKALGWSLGPRRQRAFIRWTVLAVMAASYVVAVVYQGSLVNLLLSAYGAVVQFAPLIVATLYWRRATALAATTGLLAGTTLTVLFVLFPAWRPWPLHAGLYGLVVNAALLVVLSLLSRTSHPETERFVAVAEGRRR
jgi:SSS family solute:Na+ symporter